MVNFGSISANEIDFGLETGKNNAELNTSGHFMFITDDINKDNLEKIRHLSDKNDLTLSGKFDTPHSNATPIIGNRSKMVARINSKIDKVKETNSDIITNDTQLRNLQIKMMYWCAVVFNSVRTKIDNEEQALVFIKTDKLSKHEWLFVKWLYELGVNFVVVDKCASSLTMNDIDKTGITVEICGTSENLSLETTNEVIITVDSSRVPNTNTIVISTPKYNTLEEVEKAIHENNEQLKLIISGIDNYKYTCDFYGRIYKESANGHKFVVYNTGFPKPSPDDTKAIPRFKLSDNSYIFTTMLKFLKVEGTGEYETIHRDLEESLKQVFMNGDSKGLSPQILYNKLSYIICSLNNIFKNNVPQYIVLYGKVTSNDFLMIKVLSKVQNVSLLILCPDKSLTPKVDCISVLELKSTTELFDMPTVDSRDSARTLAVDAESRANRTLFSGDTLGMYKPGQFRSCDTKNFSTTYDEISLWWNKEMYIRPGFEALGDRAIIPNMFKVIKGVKGDASEYKHTIQMFACGKTVVCYSPKDIDKMAHYGEKMNILRATDINQTLFKEQQPFIEKNKINKQRIKQGRNYPYGFLDPNKQDLILDKIYEIITSQYIVKTSFKNEQHFIDTVLNTLLNIDVEILRLIQWFEFYTYNPNVIVLMQKEEDKITEKQFIILLFLKLIGFDVLIFVPTGYASIENIVGTGFIYDTHKIGEAIYDLSISDIKVTSNIEVIDTSEPKEKKGFFAKIFK